MSPAGAGDSLPEGDLLLLDAAVGTELSRRGADTRPPLWSARAIRGDAGLLTEIHAGDAAAGADVVTAATFRTHARNLVATGVAERAAGGEADLLTRMAVALAREGAALGCARAGRPPGSVRVAGSLSPLEDCYRPELCPPAGQVEQEHEEQARRLAAAGADLIVVETMNSLREAEAAVRAAVATGLPVVVSFVTDGAGRLLSGDRLDEAARAAYALGPLLAVGVNCIPARLVGEELRRIALALPRVPLAAWGNTGRALDEAAGLFEEPVLPGAYAELAAGWVAAGARIVGGCCGTTSAHTAALRGMLDRRRGQRT